MQTVRIPEILDCYCGAKARVVDWDYRMLYRVMCDNNHSLRGENITVNRAIHKWNNFQNKQKDNQ